MFNKKIFKLNVTPLEEYLILFLFLAWTYTIDKQWFFFTVIAISISEVTLILIDYFYAWLDNRNSLPESEEKEE